MRMQIHVAVVLLVPATALAHEGHAPLPTKGATVRGERLMLSPGAAKAIGLATAKVELAEVRRTVRAVASVELPWNQQAYVTTLIPGRIEQVRVKPGQRVKAGQELARVTSVELESLQLAMLQARAELGLAARVLARQEQAAEGIAGRVILQTRTAVQQQTARLDTAWQKLRAIGLSNDTLEAVRESGKPVSTISIASPINGLISVADVRTGQMVQPTEHLYHIVDPSRVWLVGKVLEADAGRVKVGMGVQVTLATLPDEQFAAPIDHVELRLNDDRTLSVKALVDNPSGVLRAGMFGRMEIETDAAKAVVCPKDALIRDGPATYALVEESTGKYTRKAVKVASVHGQTVEIEDGLFPGDRVVTVGSHELAALFPSRQTPRPPSTSETVAQSATIAQGQVELPTDHKVFASTPVEGRVRRILVEHGQQVRRGDVLAQIESLALKTMQLDLLHARADLKQAVSNLQHAQLLGHSDALAKKHLWQLETERDTYQQSVASLRNKLALIGLTTPEISQIEEAGHEVSAVFPVRAPADGLVAEFDLIPGQVLTAHSQLFELHNPARVWVQTFLFEQDAPRISVGQRVYVTLVSDPKFATAGRVDRLNPVLLSGNRALAIWTELDNPGLRLKEGMSAMVAIDTARSAGVAGE